MPRGVKRRSRGRRWAGHHWAAWPFELATIDEFDGTLEQLARLDSRPLAEQLPRKATPPRYAVPGAAQWGLTEIRRRGEQLDAALERARNPPPAPPSKRRYRNRRRPPMFATPYGARELERAPSGLPVIDLPPSSVNGTCLHFYDATARCVHCGRHLDDP